MLRDLASDYAGGQQGPHAAVDGVLGHQAQALGHLAHAGLDHQLTVVVLPLGQQVVHDGNGLGAMAAQEGQSLGVAVLDTDSDGIGTLAVGVEAGQAQQLGRGDARAAAEAHHGDALLAVGLGPAAHELVDLGAAQLGEGLGLVDSKERRQLLGAQMDILSLRELHWRNSA